MPTPRALGTCIYSTRKHRADNKTLGNAMRRRGVVLASLRRHPRSSTVHGWPFDRALRAEDAQLGHRVVIQSPPQWHSNSLSLAFKQDLNAVNGLGVAIQTVSRWHSTWGLGARVSWVDAGRHRPRKARARVPRNHVGSLDTSSMASAQRWHARIEKKSRCAREEVSLLLAAQVERQGKY